MAHSFDVFLSYTHEDDVQTVLGFLKDFTSEK
jgi:hypothetical protein